MKMLDLGADYNNMPSPVELADNYRLEVSLKQDLKKRSMLAQYLTPLAVAKYMASIFDDTLGNVTLLDPGAGTGTLTAAFIQEMTSRSVKPSTINATVFELEPLMQHYLSSTLNACTYEGKIVGTEVSSTFAQTDFVEWGFNQFYSSNSLVGEEPQHFTHCIMNPPYMKIRSDSKNRTNLRKIGIETSNMYSAFMALAIKLLSPGGQLVAIIPRSFCNGPYFRCFRELLLEHMAIRQIHVFDSRNKVFRDDKILQENIILHAIKDVIQSEVLITSSSGPGFTDMTHRVVTFDKMVKPDDPDKFIHIATNELDQMVVDRISVFSNHLKDIGIEVSTGPVVDFRLRSDIHQHAKHNTHPLIYPGHFAGNFVMWPNPEGKKPNAIQESDQSARWLMTNGWYVVTKRFSSKEEKRRIVAAIHTPDNVQGVKVGFENHLNVFSDKKHTLEPSIAKGLAVYLNSTLVDLYFRQFSGHTQVNAADLRTIRYPDRGTLTRLGEQVSGIFPVQEEVDHMLEREIEKMATQMNEDPILIQRRMQEALSVLIALGLPKGQLNERSALTLLALVQLKPENSWVQAGSPLMGITPIIGFIGDHYGRRYAPNSRETIRKQTMHQFVEAGIAVSNPDSMNRPINSPKWCYQITPETLNLIHSFGLDSWDANLNVYLEQQTTLAERYAKEREMLMIPLKINNGKELYLTPGNHNQLIKEIITEFGPRYAPGANVLYVGDTGTKMTHFDKVTFAKLGLVFDSHGKFPDVILYLQPQNWLLLIEAVTSGGPIDAKRHHELAELFRDGAPGVVYVTTFLNRQTLTRYIGDISWETEVWCSDSPTHIIHFNGERFLGPYE